MLSLANLNPYFLHLLINQILITIMGKYSKEFRSIKKRSNCIFKSLLICLFIISTVHMSESNVEDVTENTNLIETENLQSSEEKTEEPVKAMNQAVYFQGTEKSPMEQQKNDDIVPASLSEMSSNSMLSFIPDLHSAANDDDDNEQNDAQDSYLIDRAFSGSKGNTRILRQDDSMVSKLLQGNRMLTQQLQSNDKRFIDSKKTLIDDPSLRTKIKKLYLVDHLSEMKHIRGYLPSLMKLKRLVKQCQCSYRDEDEYSSIKDAIMPNRIDHRINLDYVDDESEDGDDERDEDDEPPMNNVLRQRAFNKYKRFNLNNFREDDEDFEKVRFNELKNVEEDKSAEENSLNEFEDNSSSNGDDGSEDESVDEDELDETEDDSTKDQNDEELGNNQEINEDKENEKLLSPFMTNLSPTSSSDIIFNEFNELSMQTNQLDPNDSENEIQLAKLKRIIGDGSNANNSDALKSPNDISSNPLSDDLASSLATQYSTNNSPGNRGNQHSGQKGKNKGNDRRNLFDHLILIRKRRQINKNPKNQLVQMKGGKGGGNSGGSGGGGKNGRN